MKKTKIIMNTLNAAVASFLPELRHLPCQLRWNQNKTVTPHVNHESSSDDEMLSSELKTGMALARIQTTTQKSVTEKIHTAHSVFLLVSGTAMDERRPREGSEAMDARRSVFFEKEDVEVAHEEDVEVSCGCHSEDQTGSKQTDERHGVRDLGHCRLQRADGRRSNLLARESVDGSCDDDIYGCRDAFLDSNCAGKVT